LSRGQKLQLAENRANKSEKTWQNAPSNLLFWICKLKKGKGLNAGFTNCFVLNIFR
jgi:hypothetical protein